MPTNNVPRIFAVQCSECECNIMFTFEKVETPEISLCYSCASSYAKIADVVRNDGIERSMIELRRTDKPYLAGQVANEIEGGRQTLVVMRMAKPDCVDLSNFVTNMKFNLTNG